MRKLEIEEIDGEAVETAEIIGVLELLFRELSKSLLLEQVLILEVTSLLTVETVSLCETGDAHLGCRKSESWSAVGERQRKLGKLEFEVELTDDGERAELLSDKLSSIKISVVTGAGDDNISLLILLDVIFCFLLLLRLQLTLFEVCKCI